MKSAAGWATMAATALSAYDERSGEVGFSAFIEQCAKAAGVSNSTLWRHVAAYKFWGALREQGSFGELPPAEKVESLVSSVYVMGLAQFAQSNPRSVVQKYVHALRDGQPFDASQFAGAGPLTRGRGAGAKIIESMHTQPQFDPVSLTRAIMERLPAWSALGNPADIGGHVLGSDMGQMPERLGKPDAVFFLINDPQQDDEPEMIRLGALTLVPQDAQLEEQLQLLELAKRSLNIGQSWLGYSSEPDASVRDRACVVGVGVLLHEMVEGESRVTVVTDPKPKSANPYLRELVMSKFLRMPASVVLAEVAKNDPKPASGPKFG